MILNSPGTPVRREKMTLFTVLCYTNFMLLHMLLIFLLGFYGIITQILFLRKLQEVFYGNELSYGIILAFWLLIVGIGAQTAPVCLPQSTKKQRIAGFSYFFIAATVVLPLTFFSAHTARLAAHLLPGEIVPVSFIMTTTFLVISGNALLQGFLFSAAAGIIAEGNPLPYHTAKGAVNKVYIMEAIGACCGGLLYALVGSFFLSSFSVVFGMSALTCAFVAVYAAKYATGTATRVAVVVAIIHGICFCYAPSIEQTAHKLLFSPFTPYATAHSYYGDSTLTRPADNDYVLYYNAVVSDESAHDYTAEEKTIFGLVQLKTNNPATLVLGNGLLSIVPTLERMQCTDITVVIRDRELVRLLRDKTTVPIIDDSHIVYDDARAFVKHCQTRYDLIILAVPPPQTLELNRFYTEEFMHELSGILSNNGVVSLAVPSSENLINNDLASFLSCIERTARRVFTRVAVIPGQTAVFLMSNRRDPLVTRAGDVIARVGHLPEEPHFVNQFYLTDRLQQDRFTYLDERLGETKAAVNTDFSPRAFYYNFILWSQKTATGVRKLFTTLASLDRRLLSAVFLSLFVFLFIFLSQSGNAYRSRRAFAIATLGFTEISLEIILILAYQALFGFVHTAIALLIACYMGGLILGSGCIMQYREQISRRWSERGIVLCSFAILFYCFIILGYMHAYHQLPGLFRHAVWVYALMIDIGCIGGIQFVLLNEAYFRKDPPGRTKKATVLYSLDLIASACGALAITLFFIPLCGFYYTLLILALINAIAWIRLFVTSRSS